MALYLHPNIGISIPQFFAVHLSGSFLGPILFSAGKPKVIMTERPGNNKNLVRYRMQDSEHLPSCYCWYLFVATYREIGYRRIHPLLFRNSRGDPKACVHQVKIKKPFALQKQFRTCMKGILLGKIKRTSVLIRWFSPRFAENMTCIEISKYTYLF